MLFTFLFCVFGKVEKRLHQEAKVSFKIYVVREWKTSNYNTHITPYFSGSKANQILKFGQVIKLT